MTPAVRPTAAARRGRQSAVSQRQLPPRVPRARVARRATPQPAS